MSNCSMKKKRLLELGQLAELNELTTTILEQETLQEMALPVLKQLLGADRVTLTLIQDGEIQPLKSSDGVVYPVQPMPSTKNFQELIRSHQPHLFDAEHP